MRLGWAVTIALGCLEVGEKFTVVGGGVGVGGCLISIPTTELHQLEVGLG